MVGLFFLAFGLKLEPPMALIFPLATYNEIR